MSKQEPKKAFKPYFEGYMKIYLHDDQPERLHERAEFTGEWVSNRRHRILKRGRKFVVTVHIVDTDGDKRGIYGVVLTSKGGQRDLSSVIFSKGNEFIDELRGKEPDIEVDLVNSYAVVRA